MNGINNYCVYIKVALMTFWQNYSLLSRWILRHPGVLFKIWKKTVKRLSKMNSCYWSVCVIVLVFLREKHSFVFAFDWILRKLLGVWTKDLGFGRFSSSLRFAIDQKIEYLHVKFTKCLKVKRWENVHGWIIYVGEKKPKIMWKLM